MNINTNDPRLTAYALGELDDAERAEVETLLNNSPDARSAVDQIRQTAGHLTHELAAEPTVLLTAAQRDGITSAARDGNETANTVNARPVKLRMRLYAPLAIAASLLLLASLLIIPSVQRARTGASQQLALANLRGSGQSASIYSNDCMEWFNVDLHEQSAAAPSYALSTSAGIPVPSSPVNRIVASSGDMNADSVEGMIGPMRMRDRLSYELSASDLARFYVVSDYEGFAQSWLTDLALAGGAVDNRVSEHRGGRNFLVLLRDHVPEVHFEEQPLKGVIEFLSDLKGIPISVNWNALAEHGIKPDTPVSVNLSNATVHATLAHVLSQASANEELGFAIDDGVIRIGIGLQNDISAESYTPITHNPFLPVADNPLSTFSIDVDTASYANVRRFLNSDQLPPPDAVRVEEMINYFDYDYPPPTGDDPFSVSVDIAACPWSPDHRLMRVGLKGLVFDEGQRPLCNLVFLIDVSGSMDSSNKLPLLQQALTMLTAELYDDDRVAIVVYAGSSGLVLPSTQAADQNAILQALENLQAGGSTNGGQGIQLAYDIAADNFIEGGVNRVILATDGDFNVGITDQSALTTLIQDKAKTGVFLSVLGFGMGNLQDSTLESLADKGNGNYAYIDTSAEARKVLVDQIGGTLVTIAKDVKIQIEFNPAEVAAYRLIGYENRVLAARDFNDDTKDAGEIGAGHTVTALYEILPAGLETELSDLLDRAALRAADRRAAMNDAILPDGEYGPPAPPTPIAASDAFEQVVRDPQVDPLKYQSLANLAAAAVGLPDDELATIKLRYKEPDGEVSKLIEIAIIDEGRTLSDTSPDFRFAASVASFGMLLRHSPHIDGWTHEAVLELATEAADADDPHGYRAEFIELVERALALSGR